jgi:hypothetical protein
MNLWTLEKCVSLLEIPVMKPESRVFLKHKFEALKIFMLWNYTFFNHLINTPSNFTFFRLTNVTYLFFPWPFFLGDVNSSPALTWLLTDDTVHRLIFKASATLCNRIETPLIINITLNFSLTC